jgi:hypothetical protein
MLHELARYGLSKGGLVDYGARNGGEHPFAAETRTLLNSNSYIRYSSPGPRDRSGVDFDARGRLDIRAIEELGVPREAEFYLWAPPPS